MYVQVQYLLTTIGSQQHISKRISKTRFISLFTVLSLKEVNTNELDMVSKLFYLNVSTF